MYFSSVEIESRRMTKILIQKISNTFFCSMIQSVNLNLSPKNFSLVFLNKKNLCVKNLRIVHFRKLIGYTYWNDNSNKYCNTVKNIKYFTKNIYRFSYPFFSDFSISNSTFTFMNSKFIDSYFQIKKSFLKSLPVLFSIENIYGLLFSLAESLKILFKKFTQTSKVHNVCFKMIKKLIFKYSKRKKIDLTDKKMNCILIYTILREKTK